MNQLLTKPIRVFTSAVVYHNGGECTSRYNACCAIDLFIVGIPSGAHRFAVRLRDVKHVAGAETDNPCALVHVLPVFFSLVCPKFLGFHTGGFSCHCFPSLVERRELCRCRSGSANVTQGLHPAPSACLRCLHDTHLESANVAVDGLTPVEWRTILAASRRETAPSHTACAVVISLCLMSRLVKFSRVKHHIKGSQPAFAFGDVVDVRRRQPISAPLQSGIRFLPHLLSPPPSVHLAMHFPLCEERCGFTLFRWNDAVG